MLRNFLSTKSHCVISVNITIEHNRIVILSIKINKHIFLLNTFTEKYLNCNIRNNNIKK